MNTALRFFADWCGPCKALEPTWNELRTELSDQYTFTDVDIDANPNLRMEYNVRSIPTIVLLDSEGKELARRTSGGAKSELKEWMGEQYS